MFLGDDAYTSMQGYFDSLRPLLIPPPDIIRVGEPLVTDITAYELLKSDYKVDPPWEILNQLRSIILGSDSISKHYVYNILIALGTKTIRIPFNESKVRANSFDVFISLWEKSNPNWRLG